MTIRRYWIVLRSLRIGKLPWSGLITLLEIKSRGQTWDDWCRPRLRKELNSTESWNQAHFDGVTITGFTIPRFAAEDQHRVPNQIHCARHMQVMPGALPQGQLQSS